MIEFAREAYDDVVRRARAGDAEEVCGVLAGTRRDGDEPSVVARAHEAENVSDAPAVRYRIDPEEQLELFESIEAAGRDVVGFYHSHPAGPPRPSETDAARATWPGYSYVICALDGRPFVGSWRWRGGEAGFEQERVSVRSER
ncbi:MAG: desampylase [Methanobacteriota archaeon]